jgi:hypothetical protein
MKAAEDEEPDPARQDASGRGGQHALQGSRHRRRVLLHQLRHNRHRYHLLRLRPAVVVVGLNFSLVASFWICLTPSHLYLATAILSGVVSLARPRNGRDRYLSVQIELHMRFFVLHF